MLKTEAVEKRRPLAGWDFDISGTRLQRLVCSLRFALVPFCTLHTSSVPLRLPRQGSFTSELFSSFRTLNPTSSLFSQTASVSTPQTDRSPGTHPLPTVMSALVVRPLAFHQDGSLRQIDSRAEPGSSD